MSKRTRRLMGSGSMMLVPGITEGLRAKAKNWRQHLPTREELNDFHRLSSDFGIRQATRCSIKHRYRVNPLLNITIASERLTVRAFSDDVTIARQCLEDSQYALPTGFRFPQGDLIIDAGAYIGASSLILSRQFPDQLVVALEPDRSNYALLLKNTQRNSNILPINAALGGFMGIASLQARSTGFIGRTIVNSPADDLYSPHVNSTVVVTVQGLLNLLGASTVALLKLDIEGAEVGVLENSREWLSHTHTVVAELHDRIAPGASALWGDRMRGRDLAITSNDELHWAQATNS